MLGAQNQPGEGSLLLGYLVSFKLFSAGLCGNHIQDDWHPCPWGYPSCTQKPASLALDARLFAEGLGAKGFNLLPTKPMHIFICSLILLKPLTLWLHVSVETALSGIGHSLSGWEFIDKYITLYKCDVALRERLSSSFSSEK